MNNKIKIELLFILFTIFSILFLTLTIYVLVKPSDRKDILRYREEVQVSVENLDIYSVLKDNESLLIENDLSSELLINSKPNIIDNVYEYVFVNPTEHNKKIRVIVNLNIKEVSVYGKEER